MQLLLDIWKEAGRHDELGTVVERVAARLAGELPADALLVRRLTADRLRLEPAASAAMAGMPPPATRTELTAPQMEAVMAWARGGEVLAGGAAGVLGLVAPSGTWREAMAGPLLDGDEVIGVLVAVGSAFAPAHAARFAQLLEPLSTALRADLRRHELLRLREAAEAENRALRSRLGRQEIADAVVGADGGLQAVVARVRQVAATDVPVLLLGETGTGKEVIAREIHRHSRRDGGPVVRVNCGAVPAGLIDSELFGHERGSFTGAVAERAGWFERADGGTLFLDEIGELSAEAQVRLLRVLQDGTFERVGGRRTLTVDVRVVAATHRDLHAMVREGRFREDLWYRIGVFPIRLPPLRDRPGDIPALAAHFAYRAGQRLGGAPLVPDARDLEQLLEYPWPGNVRELAAVIERAVILGGGHRLEIAAALGAALPSGAGGSREPAPNPGAGERFPTLDEAAARHVEAALARTRGRIEGPAGAAALLGINPHTLRARMRRLGIAWAKFRP